MSVIWSVTMTVRFHLFPFRTQQLSSLVPKIVSWKRLVKIGSRRQRRWNRFMIISHPFLQNYKALSPLNTRQKRVFLQFCGHVFLYECNKKALRLSSQSFQLSRRLPIFTSRFQLTIFGTSKLNFCVRNGNRWNLTVIDTDRSD